MRAIALLLVVVSAYAQQDCPIDVNGNPLNPQCPNIVAKTQEFEIRSDGGGIRYYLKYSDPLFASLNSDDALNFSYIKNKAIGTPYIPLFEDCNLPTSKNDPGPCDVEGTFEPKGIKAHHPSHSEQSYIKKTIEPLKTTFHYSSEYQPNTTGRDKVIQNKMEFNYRNVNEYHFVLDYIHYRLAGPPNKIELNTGNYEDGLPGEAIYEFENNVLSGCNKPSISYPTDPDQAVITVKSQDGNNTLTYPAHTLRIRQWHNQIYYEATTDNALYGDPRLVICRDYLTDDIFKESFEDEIFAHGFDDRPHPFYPPSRNGYIPPRP